MKINDFDENSTKNGEKEGVLVTTPLALLPQVFSPGGGAARAPPEPKKDPETVPLGGSARARRYVLVSKQVQRQQIQHVGWTDLALKVRGASVFT